MADTGALDLGFDPAALKARYLAERDKRVRKDGNEQYVNVAGQFAHYLEDPYTERVERAPVNDHVEVAVIGGGFGVMLAAASWAHSSMPSWSHWAPLTAIYWK